MAVNHVQALDSYPMDGWRSSRTRTIASRVTLTGSQVRILHHPLHGRHQYLLAKWMPAISIFGIHWQHASRE